MIVRIKHKSKSKTRKNSPDPVVRLQETSPFRYASFEPYREKLGNHFSKMRLCNPSSPRVEQGFKSVRVRRLPNQNSQINRQHSRRVRDKLES